ncbi:MAG: KH domain-containing protein [Myxococcales bacterium]|nr:KH domain-containing protein [Myxococcales bacterium]
MQSLLAFIVESLVDDPDAVQITEGDRRGDPVLRVSVAEADRGTIIGRQGKTIRAIETVLAAASPGAAPAIEVAD